MYMKRLCIISFYELKEHLIHIKDIFTSFHYTVSHYPLFQYAYDSNDKIPNYTEHMSNFLADFDIVFWYFLDVPIDTFVHVKRNNPNICFIMYNSDDPNNFNLELLEKAKIFDIIITPCLDNYKKYIIHNRIKSVLFAPFGYDPAFFGNRKDIGVDVALVCNLIHNTEFITEIADFCSVSGLSFKIYGQPALSSLFPNHYEPFPSYETETLIYQAKINISLHKHKPYTALNPHDIKILASGGLLLTDNKISFMDPTQYIQMADYKTQIMDIIKNPDKYKEIKINGQKFASNYTWEKIITSIHIQICKKYFNTELYKELYNGTWEDFINNGIKERHIGFSFNIPNNFDIEAYREVVGELSDNKLYLHWYLNGKKKEFIKTSTGTLNISSYGTDYDTWIKVSKVIGKMYWNYWGIDDNLKKLEKYTKVSPKMNINTIILDYLAKHQ